MTLSQIDKTHDPKLACWVEGAQGHAQLPVQNLLFGIFPHGGSQRHIGVAIGYHGRASSIRPSGMAPRRLSRGPASNMYWTAQQIVAHHASNGCNLAPGDLLGTGSAESYVSIGFEECRAVVEPML